MKKIISILLIGIIVALSGVTVSAKTLSTECYSEDIYEPLPETAETITLVDGNLDINAKSCVLIEPQTQTVLYENNGNERLAPASITKIMSLLLIMEAIDAGKLKLESKITASEHACSMGGSQIWLEPGESMTLDEMLKAIVIASANDATVAVGEAIAGSEEGFVALMNERAKSLGLTGTHFVNCTGLDADGHLTTAYDVAIMSSELVKHKLITNYSTVWMDSLRGGESELVNTNKLVRFYDGCIGLKTGTTSKAGSCLSAAATRDNMTLIAVVMGGADSNSRFMGARKMLDFGFANYGVLNVDANIGDNTRVKIKGGEKTSASVKADGKLSVLTKKGEPKVERKLELSDSIKAPIKKGDVVGKVYISVDGEEVGVIDIKATESVKKRTVFMMYRWLLSAIICKK